MQWLNKIADEVEKRHPKGEIVIESGASPSGTYHFGHLREIITCDAILLELRKRGRQARHVHFVDDLDGLRKIPPNVASDYDQYLGKPLCNVPAPDGSKQSFADYFLSGFTSSAKQLGIEMQVMRSHTKYGEGFFVPAIEKALEHIVVVRNILETISGHKLGDEWSPVQVNEGGYLKKRRFVSLALHKKTITYVDKDGKSQEISYQKGDVKLDWRIDWPARWWLLKVNVEPAGRDHSTKGGSFDTGLALLKNVYGARGLLPVPYDFVNLAGDPKKMSASRGTGIDARDIVKVLPPEVVRFFMLRYPPNKRLYFDPQNGVSQLIDEFAELMEKEPNSQLLEISLRGMNPTISRIPFSHLVASYQTALKDTAATLKILSRTGYKQVVEQNQHTVQNELKYIEEWLQKLAPDEVKFELAKSVQAGKLSDEQKKFLADLADKIEKAPENTDGEWFHKAIYELSETSGLTPKELFSTLYKVLINKDAGPRAGWFLSILPRDWLIKRLKFEA